MTVETGVLWRVGYHESPLDFAPPEMYAFNHRFDDVDKRFRTLYVASHPETCLREMLADFRPNVAAIQRFVERYGPEAADDIPSQPITAKWRQLNVLAPVALDVSGHIVDLTDVPTRHAIERAHADLLAAHDLSHLDLHEITTSRRPVTQTIAGALYDQGAAAVRFPSKLDGQDCIALFEGRGQLHLAGDILTFTDPAPTALLTVADEWALTIETV